VELHRVLRPGARLVVLEFTTPPNALVRAAYQFYFHRVLPVVGRIVSGHPWAYTYLPESVRLFPGPRELEGLFAEAGFDEASHRLLTFGIAAIHWGVKA
jgi:demethylmenaquinone methyltransferase/2-methoxy-6-polyprenyl-1,4-benzoquinol methylase